MKVVIRQYGAVQNTKLARGLVTMRSTFQMLVFIGYLAALGWGGWYLFSGQMMADRDAESAVTSDTRS